MSNDEQAIIRIVFAASKSRFRKKKKKKKKKNEGVVNMQRTEALEAHRLEARVQEAGCWLLKEPKHGLQQLPSGTGHVLVSRS